MADSAEPEFKYPPPSNPVMNVLRSICAYALLGTQLAFFLFVLELPYWIADRFFCRHRGDAFYVGQKRIARWFFRLFPFGQQRHVNVRRGAFPKPCVIVCNHQSTLDILMALMLPVNARWMIKGWPFKYPLMGELNKLARHIKVEEANEEADADRPRGYDTALNWLKDGVSILVFPEGSRSPDGRIRRFKNGAFVLAVDAQVPVVPVIMEGTGACVRKGSPLVHHPDTLIKVLEPFSTEGLKDPKDAADLKQRVQARMKEELADLRAAKRKPSYPRIQGWVTRLAMFAVAMFIALLVSVSVYVKNWCIAEPPTYDGSRALAKEEITSRSMGDMEIQLLGESWRRDHDGIHELGLTGNRWERGYANARLTRELTAEQEKLLVAKVREFLPNDFSYWAAKQMVAINNRNLPEYVSDAEKLEILGLTEGSENHYPDEAPLYHRILNYHAAHDISHMFIDNPLVTTSDFVGCTGFAAWGDASKDGQIIVGRNFDFEAGDVFDQDKAVIYVWPDDGIAYVHVAWAGMAGAVTGMNAEGVSIHVNAARTSETEFGRIGTPVSMLVRRVLERAHDIDEAYKIIQDTPVFVSDTYLVASRKDGKAVVIEKSPDHCAMREAGKPGLILQTNHMLTEPLKDDPVNIEQVERATTTYRWQRLEELTDRNYGKIDRDVALSILRDRKGRGDKELGLGNRNAIDAGICCHSVIINVTTGEMWVSAAPHTYGEYVYVPVARALAAGPGAAVSMRPIKKMFLPRDPHGEEYEDLKAFRDQCDFARGYVDDEDLEQASVAVRTLVNLNPKSFETAYYEGRLAFLREKYDLAEKKFETALDRDPPYEAIREHIRQWLQKAKDEQD
ncbi:MAG: 1-acyl-sn-glycerol-3-phosphate acyltransferase [Planctomycetes bacterium]|nr:1-acyl-sn-glycerol-3-phosphate acyltransferase [Planctomycetota bacterium]